MNERQAVAEGMTREQVSQVVGVGEVRVMQIERRALRKLWRQGIRGRYRAAGWQTRAEERHQEHESCAE